MMNLTCQELTRYFRLTVSTSVNLQEGLRLRSMKGRDQELPVSTVNLMLALGWTAFISGLALNLLYYVFHPSQVEISPRNKLPALVKLNSVKEESLTVPKDHILLDSHTIAEKTQDVNLPLTNFSTQCIT